MQAKRTLLPVLGVILFALLIVAACSGGAGGQGQTWFNLPAVPVNVNADGSADIYGIGLGPVLPADSVQQLQTFNAQRIEARAGHNGLHVYVNGQDLPYLSWDDQSAANLQGVVKGIPAIAPAADALPWLRRIGLGAALKLPVASGQAALSIPRWTGETTVTPEQPDKQTPPLDLSMVSFDSQGQAIIAGIPADQLAALTGGAPIQLDSATMDLINSLGFEKLTVQTTPNGIAIGGDGNPLLNLAYDSASLQRLGELIQPALDPATAATVAGLLPVLPSLDATVNVGFGDTPLDFELPELPLGIGADGSLTLGDFSVPGVTLPADLIATLSDTGIGNLAVDATSDGLSILAGTQEGTTLPKIRVSADGLDSLAGIAASSANLDPALIATVLGLLTKDDGYSANVALPGGQAGAAPAEPTYAAPDLGGLPAPVLKAEVVLEDGQITSVGGLSAEQLAALGVDLPVLPPAVTDILGQLNAEQVDIVTKANMLEVSVNGTPTLSLDYDQAALKSALEIAKPMLGDSPLSDPAVSQLVEEQILPILTGADIQISIAVN